MISIKSTFPEPGFSLTCITGRVSEIVPSSARSSSSAASSLPSQLVPLLGEALEQVKNTINQVMPMEKPLSALEEAEYEDVGGEAGALEKEVLMQGMYRH
jgi:hypothetical protein